MEHKSRRPGVARVILSMVAALLAAVAALVVGAAPALAAATVAPPSAPGAFAVDHFQTGARSDGFTATWTPAAANGGLDLRYVMELSDGIGSPPETATTTDTTYTMYGDWCLGPLTVTVHAETTDPVTGETMAGPAVAESFGHGDDTLCAVNMSISAAQSAPGEITVSMHREPPVDPYVVGTCVLTANGTTVWSGYCGNWRVDETTTLTGLAPGAYDLLLTTTSVRGVVSPSNHVRVDVTT